MNSDIRHETDSYKDFQWEFQLNQKYLKVLGIWPNDQYTKRLNTIKWPLVFLLYILITGCFPTTYAFIQVHRQLNLAVDNLLATIAGWIAASKVVLVWHYRSTSNLLIQWAREDWSECRENWQRQLMLKHARRGRILTAANNTMMFLHANSILWNPIFDFGLRTVNNITDPNPQRYLPLQTYYPYDYDKSPFYEFTYLSQIIVVPSCICVYASSDTLFTALVFHASGQSEIIAEKMRRLVDQRQSPSSFIVLQRQLIESHTRLVRFVKAIENSFTASVLMEMLGTMVLLCTTTYSLIMVYKDSSTTTVMQVAVLISAILNINELMFFYCLSCEILASNSSELFNAIYNSKWYELPAKEARCVVLIMARSKYTLQLSAGKFFYLSLNSYVQIVKSTAGYISMLLAVS